MEKLLEEESEENLDNLLGDDFEEEDFEEGEGLKKLNSTLKIADDEYGDSEEEP